MIASRLTRRLVIAQFVCALMFGIAMLANWPGEAARDVLLNIIYLVIGAPTLWALYEASRDAEVDTERRRAWRELMWATGAWWAGDAIWAIIAFATGDRPPLSVADIAYLAFFPIALRAMARFPGLGTTTAERWRVQMDAVVAAITISSWPPVANSRPAVSDVIACPDGRSVTRTGTGLISGLAPCADTSRSNTATRPPAATTSSITPLPGESSTQSPNATK